MISQADIEIVQALEIDSERITQIAFASKRYWNYPIDFYDIWKAELTVNSDYIKSNNVFKVVYKESIIAFYSIVYVPTSRWLRDIFILEGYWLDHFFVDPRYLNQGIGRLMINHIKKVSNELGVDNLRIFVDPFAKGFYDKIGASYLYDSKSSIPGRLIPVYELSIG